MENKNPKRIDCVIEAPTISIYNNDKPQEKNTVPKKGNMK